MARGMYRDDTGWVQVDYGQHNAPIPKDKYEENGYQPPYDKLPSKQEYDTRQEQK
jgi:hypothetical protein